MSGGGQISFEIIMTYRVSLQQLQQFRNFCIRIVSFLFTPFRWYFELFSATTTLIFYVVKSFFLMEVLEVHIADEYREKRVSLIWDRTRWQVILFELASNWRKIRISGYLVAIDVCWPMVAPHRVIRESATEQDSVPGHIFGISCR